MVIGGLPVSEKFLVCSHKIFVVLKGSTTSLGFTFELRDLDAEGSNHLQYCSMEALERET